MAATALDSMCGRGHSGAIVLTHLHSDSAHALAQVGEKDLDDLADKLVAHIIIIGELHDRAHVDHGNASGGSDQSLDRYKLRAATAARFANPTDPANDSLRHSVAHLMKLKNADTTRSRGLREQPQSHRSVISLPLRYLDAKRLTSSCHLSPNTRIIT